MSYSELLEFLRAQIDKTEKALKAREQMAESWARGTDKVWRAVGCKKSKAERLKESAMQYRIASKVRIELENFRAILAILDKEEA